MRLTEKSKKGENKVTVSGVKDILKVLKANYDNYKPEDIKSVVELYMNSFINYDDETVKKAVNAYVLNDKKGFAPAVGQVMAYIRTMTEKPKLNGNEAWSLVLKAIKNGTYGSEEEYEKLPRAVQKAVGTPQQIKWWATDEDFNEGVEKSHFIRCYETEVKREREYERLSESDKRVWEELYQNSEKMLVEKPITQAISG